MKNRTYFVIILSILQLIAGCDNDKNIKHSKESSKKETKHIKELRADYQNSLDSLQNDISKLTETKKKLLNKEEFAKSEIYKILQNSDLDHIIIGTKKFNESKLLFEKLGFSIKGGKQHKNGIKNFFVEFSDSSEIEIISIHSPNDPLATFYKSFLDNEQYGFQFALRTKNIKELARSFHIVKSNFTEISENKIYTTLSQKNLNQVLPLFFIEYIQGHSDSFTDRSNNMEGLSSVWLSTKDIRKSIHQYSDFGFSLVDTVTVADIKSKTALLKNDNFELILIESKNYDISGTTIKITKIKELQKHLAKNLDIDIEIKNSKRGRSIYLSPLITKSIWIEFLEN